ncbi:Alpha/beta hydrolase family protein [Sanguibacter gelidistatuariae]|uniref:Alpha/beta hydrolase family protein n=1 Tax=Sanguibacter gelidistatuariae TaxID=1814289 RepID=A0A1G6URM9_9MICO|nr:alpha/beta fold hydrolase [Sanguibacter gelidistatuariae]SDD43356.1 Alpha/beta hydrolase family protein [Sanguibacter gelidistatuariae]
MTRAPAVLRAARAGWAWGTDYAYVTWRQARGLLRPRDPSGLASGPRIPVVLVPGIYETWFFLEPLARALHRAGHPVVTVPALGLNTFDLETSARLVADRIAELGGHRVVLVAHSKGGLIGKYLLNRPGLTDAVVGVVAVNTPFRGSVYATRFPSRPVRALAPRFPDMVDLARDSTSHGRIVSIYGDFDPHIPGGSALEGAVNVHLPVMGHFRTVAHPEVLAAVTAQVARLEETSAPTAG